jgi:hypothetical protein
MLPQALIKRFRAARELLFFDGAQRKDNQKKGRFPDQS